MPWKQLLALCFALVATTFAQQRAMWHHATSPYRAVFEIQMPGNHPKAGVLLQVPTSGLGSDEGDDVFCFDDRGKQLPRMSIGAGLNNQAIVIAEPTKDSKRIYAYFGSKSAAPSANMLQPLMCEVRTLPEGEAKNWTELEQLLKKSKSIAKIPVTKISEVSNLADSRERFAMNYTGLHHSKQPRKVWLFIATDDCGYLFVNGKPIIERNGVNSVWNSLRGENRKEVDFQPGIHEIKLVAANFEKDFAVALGQAHVQGNKVVKTSFFEGAEFILSGKTSLTLVEGKGKTSPVPAFWYKHASYMALGNDFLNEIECGTYSEQEADWTFGDGVVLKGAKINRVVCGLDTLSVRVAIKRATARGQISFPAAAPAKTLNINNQKDYEYYGGLLINQGVKDVDDVKALALQLRYFARKDCHPSQIPVAKAILATKRTTNELRDEALICLARSASVSEPKLAEEAFDRLLRGAGNKETRIAYLGEAIEFAVFCLRDYQLAEKWLRQHGRTLKKGSKTLANFNMDIALQSGNIKEAAGYFTELLEGKRLGETQREAAVRGKSLQQEALLALNAGRIIEAHEKLSQWAIEAPMDRGNGSFSLTRAKYFRKRGWLDGALGELDGAILADPLLPNLPDVEFEKAKIYEQAGNKEKAKELYKKIAVEYPNHPAAEEASTKRW